MKVCGFTIIRNAVKYDYPVVESIQSLLPICDAFVVAVGQSDDNTLQLIKDLASPKITIIETIWDDSLREGGKVLAAETNKAFDAISAEYDWCFYLQSDEVIHENDFEKIKQAMMQYKDDSNVDGLLFNYIHFYASYDYIGVSRVWYRNEIRIIKNNKNIRSYRDAQGFRKNGKKLTVRKIDANIYHYGWVKHPSLQMAKQLDFNKLWHSDEWIKLHVGKASEYDYTRADIIEKFNGSHPRAMSERIKRVNWQLHFDPTKLKAGLKFRVTYLIEKITGIRLGEYKNYTLLK
jgi:hypothetical protein